MKIQLTHKESSNDTQNRIHTNFSSDSNKSTYKHKGQHFTPTQINENKYEK